MSRTGKPLTSYMICTSPRSGSTLLCRLLAATGVAGKPESYFHTPSIDRWIEAYGIDSTAYASDCDALRRIVAEALRQGRSGTDLFGLRMQRGSFPYFMQQLHALKPDLASDGACIEAVFGPTLFIHLTRDNKLEQAISRVKAEQTGLWHLGSDGAEIERQAPHKDPVYDGAAIAKHMAEFEAFDAQWTDWFARTGIKPLTVRYMELSADPHGVLKRLLCKLDQDPGLAARTEIPTEKLSDDVSGDWAARYIAECSSRN